MAPSNVPLVMVTNPRSIYNKLCKIKTWLKTVLPDLCILSEHWGRKSHLQEALEDLPQYKALEYSRARVAYKSRKNIPHKNNATGGGAAIIYNTNRFDVEELVIDNPEGVETVFAIVTPKIQMKNGIHKILVGAVYIAPRSQFKQEALDHIIETMYFAQSQQSDQLKYLIAGDVNRTNISDVLDSNGLLQQVCSVPTRNTSILENIITDLATFYHPPTTLAPLENDEEGKGRPSDHNMLVFAPKVGTQFQQKRKKRSIKFMPMPESGVNSFMRDLSGHKWTEVYETQDAHVKAANFHVTLTSKLKKHFKEKHVKMSDLDKEWFTPALKQQKAEMVCEFYKCGETDKWKRLRSKYKQGKRAAVKRFYRHMTDGLRLNDPAKFYKTVKRIGNANKESDGEIRIESIVSLTPEEQVERVAESFAKVSQEYSVIALEELPSFLPALPPPQVNLLSVWKRVQDLKKTKSTLPGDLPDKLRKEAAIFLAEPLTNIFNTCLIQGAYPKTWKEELVTPVPKKPSKLKELKDVRKIASTSDFSKVFEKYLKEWIIEDISCNLSPSQHGGRAGVGTEHVVVKFVDRVLSLLDKSSTSPAVMVSFADWRGAFDRQDPTITISKLIKLGVRSSLVPILIDYLRDRKMRVKMNGVESHQKHLIGGSPQGTILGQLFYIGASDDAAIEIKEEDKLKYIDDLEIFELISISGALIDYDFTQHVASDVGINQKFLPASTYGMQNSLNNLATWTESNKMALNEDKTNYMIFSRSRSDFATRLTVNGCKLDQAKVAKLLGVWVSEDLSWSKNCQEISKKAYPRINMLSKLKYAGMKQEDLVNIYILHIRSVTEYCSSAFHTSLTTDQDKKLEAIQKTALKVIMGQSYVTYENALQATGLKTLNTRREERCLSFGLKAIRHKEMRNIFPINQVESNQTVRGRETFHVNFAHTEAYKISAVPSIQRMLNKHAEEALQKTT